jgi:hypothetical protein
MNITKEPHKIKIDSGGTYEFAHWEIAINDPVSVEPCKHCFKEGSLTLCPRVVVAFNEAGYNSTGVCLDCIVEAAAKIGHAAWLLDQINSRLEIGTAKATHPGQPTAPDSAPTLTLYGGESASEVLTSRQH